MALLAVTPTVSREAWSSAYVVDSRSTELTPSQLPPVMNYGSKELQARIVPAVLKGDKFIALAISEAFAGSDVQGLKTTAVKTADGKHFIVNGTKKWITKFVAPSSPPDR